MAKTFYGSGVIVTSKWLNGARQIFFDGQDLDWHYDPLGLRSLVTTGPDGLDSRYITLSTNQPNLSNTGVFLTGQPISGDKVVSGAWHFGFDPSRNPTLTQNKDNAPRSFLTNLKYGNAIPGLSPAQRYAALADSDLITKLIFTEQIDEVIINYGATGPAGATGVAGATGIAGPTGASGATGPIGVSGATGIAGPTGASGVIGVSGATGPAGATGVTGATGVGETGPAGATGPLPSGAITGVIGASAPSGVLTVPSDLWFACSDETTDLTTGLKLTFRMPYAMTLTSVFLSTNTAPTGSSIVVDIRETGATIFSTKPQIAAAQETGGSGAVFSDSSLAALSEITIYVDQIGSTLAGTGLKVWLLGYRA